MLSDLDEREQVRTARKRRGRVALAVDMLKSYAGPVVLAAFLNPLLQNGAGGSSRFGVYNYLLLVAGLAMIGLAFIFAPERD